MERWDVLDASGTFTGRTCARAKSLPPGDYHLAVDVILVNPAGEFLVQKRSMTKEFYPGLWGFTGGAVLAGEDSRQAALREVREEVGLSLDPGALVLAGRQRRRDSFMDFWFAPIAATLDEMTMQDGEVDELKFISEEAALELMSNAPFRDAEGREIISRAIRARLWLPSVGAAVQGSR